MGITMERYQTYVCDMLFKHLKPGLTPPIASEEEENDLKENIEKLVTSAGLHPMDDGDMIWRKLAKNKKNFAYFNAIIFV